MQRSGITLASRSFRGLIEKAKEMGYSITLLFFWLRSEELAIGRVATRVQEGGHNIPEQVIRRRYHRGLKNFFNIYRSEVDRWIFINNSGSPYEIVANSNKGETEVNNEKLWNKINAKR